MAWNPQARRSQTFDVEASRDENGRAQATVTMTAWTASDRLAYMNITGRSIRKGPDGSRTVDVGELTLDHVARTITAADGFGDIEVLDPRSGVVKTQPFDPSRREHLEALSADVLEELAEYAEKVQPTRRKKKGEAEEDLEDDILGETPPTTPVPDDDAPPASAVPGEAPGEAPDGYAGDVAADDEDPSRA